ncbi:metalloprotease PmbA [Legionella israelensis]|uniref:Metalloprotease PmbA n=1 Tax=Legionella israelensis TaxID=454 RepID=A0AAX1EGK6_9GAMM|nr:metalloprotease PmbA [Legionella israelensis]QBR83949.1 metalloprotease PmbA [Legionella israelensis]
MQLITEHNNTDLVQSTKQLKTLMQEVLSRALQQGATEAAVSVNHDQGFSTDVRMGQVETVAFGEDKGIGLTVYYGHRKGSASSTDTSSEAIDALVKAACDIARISAEDPCFGLADKELLTNDYPQLELYHDWNITPAEAIEMALACESDALAADKRIVNSDGVSVSTSSVHYGYANTKGAEGIVHGTRHGVSCSLIAKLKDEMQRDYDYTTARRAEDLLPAKKLAESAVDRALSRLGAKQIKTQKIPVVFSSRISSGLFSSFISAISGSNLYRKNSFLLNACGQRIFPSFISIYEQPHLPWGLGSASFDSEGVPTRRNEFVKEGQLCQYVLGSYAARRLGLQTTANSDGVHNLTISPNAGELEDILKIMGRGLLVTELMGQGVNILTGDYSRGASGFWVEDGKIQFPVEEVTIAGNLKTIFQQIRAVGTDINPNIATRCGSVLIEEMTVAGS